MLTLIWISFSFSCWLSFSFISKKVLQHSLDFDRKCSSSVYTEPAPLQSCTRSFYCRSTKNFSTQSAVIDMLELVRHKGSSKTVAGPFHGDILIKILPWATVTMAMLMFSTDGLLPRQKKTLGKTMGSQYLKHHKRELLRDFLHPLDCGSLHTGANIMVCCCGDVVLGSTQFTCCRLLGV